MSALAVRAASPRRQLLVSLAVALAATPSGAQASAASLGATAKPLLPNYAEVRPSVALRFPTDHGAHPGFRTEWWYITGWLDGADRQPIGFQVTFFRTRPEVDQRNPSHFAPKQILLAHAAVSDPRVGRLVHDQRIARAGFGLVGASTSDMDIRLDDWRLFRAKDGRFIAQVAAKGFRLDLGFVPTQPAILQGQDGYSRKGPLASQASHYYSVPHLKVSGSVRLGDTVRRVTGRAWLDREWSSIYLDPRAVGWDWVGLNLDDGAALTAFQLRDAAGRARWAGGSLRDAKGVLRSLGPRDVTFGIVRRWRSPRSGATYPVEHLLTIRLGGSERRFRIRPLFDDQELDSRAGGGPVYWEGAVRVDGGRGYLELTGYAQPLKM